MTKTEYVILDYMQKEKYPFFHLSNFPILYISEKKI
jgi:hypothetical protein